MEGNEYNMVYQFEQWSNITIDKLRKSYKFALGKGANIIRNATRDNLKTDFPNAFKKNPKYSDRISDGIRISIFKDLYAREAKVHIMGSRKAGSQTYKLRFFENYGTERTKGHPRGSLPIYNFFGNAVSSSKGAAQDAITQTLAATLHQINSEKF